MKKLLISVTHAGMGGVAKHVIEISKFMIQNKGWEVDIAVGLSKSELIDELKLSATKVFTLNSLKREIFPFDDIRAYFSIMDIIKRNNYHLVHSHGPKAGFITRLAAHNLSVKNIYTHHLIVYNQSESIMNPFYKCLEKKAARWCDKIIVVSSINKNILVKDKIADPDKIEVIYNWAENKVKYSRNEARNILRISPEEFVILSIMRLQEPKDPLTGIKAFMLFKQQKPNSKYILIGDGPLKKEISAFIETTGLLDSVIMPGFIKDVDLYLAAADVFILTTKKEGLPISIIEAMKYGLPIIANRVDGINEQIYEGKNGYFINIADYQDLCNKLISIYNNKDLRTILGNESRKIYIEKFRYNSNLEKLYNLYMKVIEK